jgi:hypothetical protein
MKRLAGHKILFRCAEILDFVGDYKDSDRITSLLYKYAEHPKDIAIDSLENDYDRGYEEGGDEEIRDVDSVGRLKDYPEDKIPRDLDLNPDNRSILDFYAEQGENGPDWLPEVMGKPSTKGDWKSEGKRDRWLGNNFHVKIHRAPTDLDKPGRLTDLWTPRDETAKMQAINKDFISKTMPETGNKSRSTIYTPEYRKKFKTQPGTEDVRDLDDSRRIVFDRKLLGIVNSLMSGYNNTKKMMEGETPKPRADNLSDAVKPISAFNSDELMKLSLRGLSGQERKERIEEISERISQKIEQLREDRVLDIESLDNSTLRALVKAMLYSEAQRQYYPSSMNGIEMAKPEEGFKRNYYPDSRQFDRVNGLFRKPNSMDIDNDF